MENQINSSNITEQLLIVAPERWEAPQLLKTDFDNTESGKQAASYEGGVYGLS
jgi:hypothetical protein